MNEKLYNEILKAENYSDYCNSYSPFLSSIGLQVSEGINGVGDFYLHYNRVTRRIFKNAIAFDKPMNKDLSDITRIVFGDGETSPAFYKSDAFLFESRLDNVGLFPEKGEKTIELPDVVLGDTVFFSGYSENGDERDPDKYVPYKCGVKIISGKYDDRVITPENGLIRFAAVFAALDIDDEMLNGILDVCPDSVEDAEFIGKALLNAQLKDFDAEFRPEDYPLIAKSVRGLIFNTAACPGKLKNHLTSFPNRGGYPAQFIWDTFFHNLAFEEMSVSTAKEFLLQMIENQRPDGKYPQFICSTWDRPHEAQPALAGAMARRIIQKRSDKEFEQTVLDSLIKNNNWWLTQRMTDHGVIYAVSGFETGQDNSPRFDKGPTLAADMNGYLLDQMKFTSQLAEKLSQHDRAEFWKAKADLLEKNMMAHLYDADSNLFFDVSVRTGEKIRIVSPSSFIPLWAKIGLEPEKAKDMIEKYLINEEYLFSKYPFPSVAYNEGCYSSHDWWRGPVWISMAYFMLEILKDYEYNEEYIQAVKRLHKMIGDDAKMSELFDSQSGKGLGFAPQGWTCAVFIELCRISGEE
ncbi:MAG: hypothetical protein IJU39_04640 [Clostridia bacterium]|nr:hypothetical protein [Clostridia bacterium]